MLNSDNAPEISFTRSAEADLPRAVQVTYIQSENEYQPGAIEVRTEATLSTRVDATDVPIVMDAAKATGVAERWMAEVKTGREGLEFTAPPSILEIEPGDVVKVAGRSERYRVDRIDDGQTRELTLTKVERQVLPPNNSKERASALMPVDFATPVVHHFMDLPVMDSPGEANTARIAAFSSPWGGAVSLAVSTDEDSFTTTATVKNPSVIGELITDLPFGSPYRWQYPTGLLVKVYGGGLSSATELAVLNGSNMAAVMSPGGEWEIIQFREAELVGDGLYELKGLLRGQFGTEHLIGDPTPVGASFVLLSEAQASIQIAGAHRGLALNYRIGPARKHHSHESHRQFEETFNAIGLRPYSPAQLKAFADESGAVQVNWVRRSRIDGDSWQSIDPSLGETREAYLLRVTSSGAVKREVELNSPTFVYTATAQQADSVSGEIEISVAQISDQFGPGPEAKVSTHV
ncbi:MAG: phage tail protein [Pikeienuella sp.]